MHPARPMCPPQRPDGQVGTHHPARKAGWSDGCGKGALTLTFLHGGGEDRYTQAMPLTATPHLGTRAQRLQAQLGGPSGLGASGLNTLPTVGDPLQSRHTLIPTLAQRVRSLQPRLACGCHVPMGPEKAGLDLRAPALPVALASTSHLKEPVVLLRAGQQHPAPRDPGAPRRWWQKPEEMGSTPGLQAAPPPCHQPWAPRLGRARLAAVGMAPCGQVWNLWVTSWITPQL